MESALIEDDCRLRSGSIIRTRLEAKEYAILVDDIIVCTSELSIRQAEIDHVVILSPYRYA